MNKKSTILAITAIVALGLAACREKGAEESAESKDSITQTVCPVSGEELGSMGEPVVMTHDGKEVKLCCKNCIEKFEADPAKYASQVR